MRASVSVVGPFAEDMTVYFYAILFTRYPQVRELFPDNWTYSAIVCCAGCCG